MENIIYLLVWASLLIAPPLGFLFYKATQRHWGKQKEFIAKGCATSLATIGIASCTGIQFVAPALNIACFIFAYLVFCFLAANSLQISKKFFRWAAITVCAVPILFGYLMGTIGFLGLAFIVGDQTRPPNHIEAIKPHLICRISSWGTAFSASGYAVDLYERWDFLPFLERHIEKIRVDETDANSKRTSCQDAMTILERSDQ